MTTLTTEQVLELIEILQGKRLTCDCAARSPGECCCDTYWPENHCGVAADALSQLLAEKKELETKYECDCKEVHAARIYLRDQERLLRDKAALAEQNKQMREALDAGVECWDVELLITDDVFFLMRDALALSTAPAEEALRQFEARVADETARKVIGRCIATIYEDESGRDSNGYFADLLRALLPAAPEVNDAN